MLNNSLLYENTFFNDDILIDATVFNNFPIDTIVSWQQILLMCAIRNIEVNKTFINGILCAIPIFPKLYDVILDNIKNSDELDNFIDSDIIEIITKIYSPLPENRTYKAKEFWLEYAYKNKISAYKNFYKNGIIANDVDRFRLYNAIFAKNPIEVIKFYNKYSLVLQRTDYQFVNWLKLRCEVLSTKNDIFKKIYDALCKEIHDKQNIQMHLH